MIKLVKSYSAIVIILVLFTLGCFVGCSRNSSMSKTISKPSAYPRTINRADRDKRYFIMYSGVDTYKVTSVEVERAKHQFTVHLSKVDSAHMAHLKNSVTFADKLIQLYMRDSASYTLDEPHTIPVSKVARIELSH